ncbi:unnamed protein product [Calypogeia fissa]
MSPSAKASSVMKGDEGKFAKKSNCSFSCAANNEEKKHDSDNISEARDAHKKAVQKTITRLKLKALQEARHGLYIPLTPRTVEKKWRTKERIRKIIATLKVSPRPFEKGGGMAKLWRIRQNARETHVVKTIREKLIIRKAAMKPFTSKKVLASILEVYEDEENVEDPVKASIASKFEYMARELIDKTAFVQARWGSHMS